MVILRRNRAQNQKEVRFEENYSESKVMRGRRPRKKRKEGGNLEVITNNEVINVNGELAGEEEAKDLNLECIEVAEAVQENGIAEKGGKEVGEDNDGRSDEGEKVKSSSGSRILGRRKSRRQAELKMGKTKLEDEELHKDMKKTKVGEKEARFEGNSDESELNKREGDGKNKKKRGRESKSLETQKEKGDEKEAGFEESGIECEAHEKDGENKKQGRRSKDLQKQDKNGEEASKFADQKDKEQEGAKKKIGKIVSKRNGEEGQGEKQKKDGHNRSRIRDRTRKVNTEEASKRRRLKNEDVRYFV